jgi:hypothetical protein
LKQLSSSTLPSQEDEISKLKEQIASFEQRFRDEVSGIQRHYKANYKEQRSKRKQQIRDLIA